MGEPSPARQQASRLQETSVSFPLVVDGAGAGIDDDVDRIREIVAASLYDTGAILFRHYRDCGEEALANFARCFAFRLSDYDFGSTPRTALTDGIYTSTEYPAHQAIPLHNEQSYTTHWPALIWFHAVQVADQGGATPIADSRRVYQRLDPALRRRFAEKKLCYVRNYGNGLDLEWQAVFNTTDPAAVEAYCRANDMHWRWKADGELRTWQVCQSEITHPVTGETAWFNQAHLFHVSNLDCRTRETLLSVVGEADLPRNVYYGDGTPIEEAALDEIRGVLEQETRRFAWQRGDILMLDNRLVAHGREPYSGDRKVVVAMA